MPSTLVRPTGEQRESALDHAQQSVRDERDLQVLADASDKSTGGARSGIASLMRRAVQQAKAEAAAQAAAGTGQASHATDSGQSAESQEARSTKGKTALAAMVQQPAERTQHEEAEAAAAVPGQEPSPGPDEILSQQAGSADDLDNPHPFRLSQQDDAVDPEQLQMSGLSQDSGSSVELQASDPDSGRPPMTTQSLGTRLGSMLKNALSPSRHSSYIPVDADSPPKAEGASESSGQVTPGTGRSALPQDANLGQRLGY